jgi:hypothetical protein
MIGEVQTEKGTEEKKKPMRSTGADKCISYKDEQEKDLWQWYYLEFTV